MTTTTDFIAASTDEDLIRRAAAAAQMRGVPDAGQWVRDHFADLCQQAAGDGQTVADVYAYALNARRQALGAVPPEPGGDLAAVTDGMLTDAIDAVYSPTGGTE